MWSIRNQVLHIIDVEKKAKLKKNEGMKAAFRRPGPKRPRHGMEQQWSRTLIVLIQMKPLFSAQQWCRAVVAEPTIPTSHRPFYYHTQSLAAADYVVTCKSNAMRSVHRSCSQTQSIIIIHRL